MSTNYEFGSTQQNAWTGIVGCPQSLLAAPLKNRYFALSTGETVGDQQGIIVSDPHIGTREYGLSDAGMTNLLKRAGMYRQELRSVTGIVSSDFLGSQQTASFLSDILGCPVEHSPLLRERFRGGCEGTSTQNYRQVWEQDRLNQNHTCWNVESVRSVVERMVSLIRRLENRDSGATFVLVSHLDPLLILESVFKGRSPRLHADLPPLQPGELRPLTCRVVRFI